MNAVLQSALTKVKAKKPAELTDQEAGELYGAAKAKAPKRTKEQLAKEATARAKFIAEDLEKHDTLQDVYEGLRELDVDDDQATAAIDPLIRTKHQWNVEQAEAKFEEVEKAIADSYGI